MKLIHCADLHLDSPMESNLPPEKARERKNEILSTFSRLTELADKGGVSAILISGDLFDSERVTKRTEKYVLDLIASHPTVSFFYLAGNHDRGGTVCSLENRPDNLYTFSDGWRSYDLGEVTVTGSERPDLETLSLREDRLNILMLHGQEKRSKGAMEADVIRFPLLKNKHIDYVALGHLHEYRTAKIDPRCTACYSGCLEGRGFDECGQKGYVLLETVNNRIEHRFVPIARRMLHTVECDVSDVSSHLELEERMLASLEGISSEDLIKMVLVGDCSAVGQKDLRRLAHLLSEKFYFAKIKDESRLKLRPEDYENDVSLKGEFVRRVLAAPKLTDAEKERIIACGFAALSGEEVDL